MLLAMLTDGDAGRAYRYDAARPLPGPGPWMKVMQSSVSVAYTHCFCCIKLCETVHWCLQAVNPRRYTDKKQDLGADAILKPFPWPVTRNGCQPRAFDSLIRHASRPDTPKSNFWKLTAAEVQRGSSRWDNGWRQQQTRS